MDFCRTDLCPFRDCTRHPSHAPNGFAYTAHAYDETCERVQKRAAEPIPETIKIRRASAAEGARRWCRSCGASNYELHPAVATRPVFPALFDLTTTDPLTGNSSSITYCPDCLAKLVQLAIEVLPHQTVYAIHMESNAGDPDGLDTAPTLDLAKARITEALAVVVQEWKDVCADNGCALSDDDIVISEAPYMPGEVYISAHISGGDFYAEWRITEVPIPTSALQPPEEE